MKKVGFIAASVGTAVLLAAGAVALTTTLLSPNHGVEQANAVEVAPVAAMQTAQSGAVSDGTRGGWFSWFGGGSERTLQTTSAGGAEGERQVLPGITSRAGAAQSSNPPTTAPQSASGDDDDDDDDDDD